MVGLSLTMTSAKRTRSYQTPRNWKPLPATGGGCSGRALGALLGGLEAFDDRGDVGEVDALFSALGCSVDDGDDVEVIDGHLDVAVAATGRCRQLDLGAETGAAIAQHAGEEGADGVAESEVKPAPHFAGYEVNGDQLVAAGCPLGGDALGRRVQRFQVGYLEPVLGQLVGDPFRVNGQRPDVVVWGSRGKVELVHGVCRHCNFPARP